MAKNAFAFLGLFAVLLLSLGMVSAGIVISNPISQASAAEDSTSFTFTFNLTYSSPTVDDANITFKDSIITPFGTLVIPNATNMNGTANEMRTIIGTVSNFTNQGGNSLTVYINATSNTGARNDDKNFTVSITDVTAPASSSKSLCEDSGFAEKGNLEISDFDVNNNGEGDNEEWQYLDEIEVIVELKNTHASDDIKDVEVMIVILDNKLENGGNDVTNDFNLDDEVITSIGTLKDGTSNREEVTFRIGEVPAELDSGTYYMYIMAYEQDNEEEQCESKSSKLGSNGYYFQFEIVSVDDDEAVVAKGLTLDSAVDASCGQKNIEIEVPIYNLGEDDQDRVLIILSNSALGIYESKTIRNLDRGDREDVVFFVDIPTKLSKDKYDLDVSVYFNWDDDEDDQSPASYDDETSTESVRLNIVSCKGPSPTIRAVLDSETIVGKELVVKATITNNGEDNDFTVSVSGFEGWADLVSVTPQSTSIDEGEFAEVTIVLMPKNAGTQNFKINAIVDGETSSQQVSVTITEKPGLFSGMTNTTTYLIIGIAAVLILILLVLIIKVSTRSRRVPQF